MTNEEIRKEVMDGNLTITDVIDVVVEVNGLIGVGLITLGDDLKEYCWHHSRQQKQNWLRKKNSKTRAADLILKSIDSLDGDDFNEDGEGDD